MDINELEKGIEALRTEYQENLDEIVKLKLRNDEIQRFLRGFRPVVNNHVTMKVMKEILKEHNGLTLSEIYTHITAMGYGIKKNSLQVYISKHRDEFRNEDHRWFVKESD